MKRILLVSCVVALVMSTACSEESNSLDPRVTKGRYMGQDWHIDENHVLHWDGKPFIPSFLNDVLREHLLYPDSTVEQIKEDIDAALDNGTTQLTLEALYFKDELAVDTSEADEWDRRIKEAAAYIHARGGTYHLYYSNLPSRYKLLAKQDPAKYQECLALMQEFDEVCPVNVADLAKPELLAAFREDLRRVGRLTATPALRSIELFDEMGGVHGDEGDLLEHLQVVFNAYGKIAKEEIGDVPVVFRSAETARYALSGLRAESFDGVVMQFSGPMPDYTRTHAQRASINLRVLNSCSKTKVYWAYAQGRVATSFFLFRSKELMRGHYLAMIEGGVTGFPFDQFSSSGFGTLGLPEQPRELRGQNHQWWVELRPEFEAEILRRAKDSEFTKGRWAVPIEDAFWHPAPTLTQEQAESIARQHPDVTRLLDLGAQVLAAQWLPDWSAWQALVTGESGEAGMIWDMWVDDSPDGDVVLNGIQLVEEMRRAGYPIPSDQELLNLAPDCGVFDPCQIDGKPGCLCPQAMCLGEEYANGCCPAGLCN